tara:strand:+ start:5261 stop:5956 length:696 start_codon:yes stop_codon:yes gene_type:complete
MSDQLLAAMSRCNAFNQTDGVPQRGGKKYTQVKERVTAWRETFGLAHGVESEIIKDDGKVVVVKSTIRCEHGRVLATGIAEEVRGSSNVNTTSALENCETSALGRALAAMGLHGGEFASANEMDKPARMQAPPPEPQQQQGRVVDNVADTIDEQPTPQAASAAYEQTVDTTEKWVRESIAGFEKHKHTGEHKKWLGINKATLIDVKKNNQPLYQALIDAYQERNNQLTGAA